MRISRRTVLAAASLAPAVAARGQPAPAKPHTFDELLRAPVVSDAAISPDGAQLAVLHQQAKGDATHAYVTLSRIADMDARPAVVDLGEYQVDQVEWAKNDRLLIWITLWKDSHGRPYGIPYYGVILPVPMRRVISVGLGGADGVMLFADEKTVMRRAFDAARVVDLMHHDPRQVLMQAWDTRRNAFSLYEVDVYTGHAEVVEKGGSATDFWLTQRGVPMLRMDSNRRGTVVSVFARAPGENDWKLVRKSRRNELKKLPDFDVVGPTPDAGVFLVSLRAEGEDTKAVRTYDIRTLQFGEVVGGRPPHDADGAVIDENLDLVAVSSQDDRVDYRFADPGLGAHYAAVNKALKNVSNVRVYDISLDHQRLLLRATGPQEPGAFHLYDRETRRLHMIAVTRPWLEPSRLAAMETLDVRTRDGATIRAYLSTPPGAAAGPRPMVVLVHGGPEDRDTYDYGLLVQGLAAQGWLVLQPNFRGSGGYGKAFADAGHGRWGDRLQQDVADAVAQVVAAGRADPKRVAICGASYGGYAAMMGPVLRPDLYRCAVAIAGPSDLAEMLKYEREDGDDSPTYAYWVGQIGDPKADAAAIRDASPRFRAEAFPVPLMLIHGAGDAIVPAKQSELMAAAMKAAGKPCEHIVVAGEGHRDWSTESWKTLLEKATGFIAGHI